MSYVQAIFSMNFQCTHMYSLLTTMEWPDLYSRIASAQTPRLKLQSMTIITYERGAVRYFMLVDV